MRASRPGRRDFTAEEGAPLGLVRTAGVLAIAAKIALIPLVFDPLGEDAFGVPKSAVSRAAMYLLICLGSALLLRDPQARIRLLRARALLVSLTILVLIAGLATAAAVHQPTALFGMHHRYLGAVSMLDGVVLAIALPLFIATTRDLRIVVVGGLAGAWAVVGYAVLQSLGVDPFSWGQVSSSVGNRGVYAGFLVVVGATAAFGAVAAPPGPTRVALAALLAAAVALVVRSEVRAATMVMPVALAAGVVFALRHSGIRLARTTLLAVAGVVLASAVAIGAIAAPRLATLLTGGDTSIAERSLVYAAAVRMVADRPLLGAGPDGFGVLYPAMRPPDAARYAASVALSQTSAHSWPLHHAVGTGLLGLAALVVIASLAIRSGLLRGPHGEGWIARPSGAVIVVAFLLQGALTVTSVSTEFLFWLGVGLSAVALRDPEASPGRRAGSRRGRLWVQVVPIALGAALALTVLSWPGANRAVRASDALRSGGRLADAEQAALTATRLDPGRANHWNVLGLAYSQRSPSLALRAFERAWAAAPYEPRYLINVIKEEERLGDTDPTYRTRARDHAQRLVEMDPRGPEAHMILSFALLKVGDAEGARREAELAITFAPEDPQYYDWSAAIHEDTRDFATAAVRYERAVAMATRGAEVPPSMRARLGGLYVRAGLPERARPLVEPRVTAATMLSGSHMTVAFDSPLGLATEGPGSAQDVAKYRVDGRPLPAGTTIRVEREFVTVLGPPDASWVRSGSVLVVTGVRDSAGFRVSPDPTTVAVR